MKESNGKGKRKESYYEEGIKILEKERKGEKYAEYIKKEVEKEMESKGKKYVIESRKEEEVKVKRIVKFVREGLKRKGLKSRIIIKGRIEGSERSKEYEVGKEEVGKIRRKEEGKKSYGVREIRSKYGVISVKVWIEEKSE